MFFIVLVFIFMAKELVNMRGGFKGVISQILPRFKTELENKDLSALKQTVSEIESYAERIKELDSQILDFSVENPEVASQECLDQYNYHKTYSDLLCKAKELLKTKIEPVVPKEE